MVFPPLAFWEVLSASVEERDSRFSFLSTECNIHYDPSLIPIDLSRMHIRVNGVSMPVAVGLTKLAAMYDGAVSSGAENPRFGVDVSTLKTGQPEVAAYGIASYMRITEEHHESLLNQYDLLSKRKALDSL